MADRLMPKPERKDRVGRGRLETEHVGPWKDIRSHLQSVSYSSIPSKRSIPSEPASDSEDRDSS